MSIDDVFREFEDEDYEQPEVAEIPAVILVEMPSWMNAKSYVKRIMKAAERGELPHEGWKIRIGPLEGRVFVREE